MSLRYSIYKVQTSFVLLTFVRSELLYFITSCRTCQELFSSFFKFFLMFVVLQALAFHHTTFLVYHKQFVLSRTFFLFFRISFDLLCFVWSPASDLAYISITVYICQALFTKTCTYFCAILLAHRCLFIADGHWQYCCL